MSDKTSLMLPPYASAEQQAVTGNVVEAARSGGWGRSRAETHRLFVAGGGDDAQFAAAWERGKADARATADAIEAGTYHSALGCLHYLVAGRRPS